MEQDDKKALVLQTSTELAVESRRKSPVIKRMTRDVLLRAESQGVSRARFRLGEFLLREPDYLQICDWAAAMDMTPEEVLNRLAGGGFKFEDEDIAFAIEDDAIVSLVWNFEQLPYPPETWRDDLALRSLAFAGDWPYLSTALQPRLPRLERLHLVELGKVSQLDLNYLPRLTNLNCYGNGLTELDLSPVPRLTNLNCYGNELTELDLSPVPRLTNLNCGVNGLSELDLSPVPRLTNLNCGVNGLSELDLSPVPRLTELDCSYNKLTELDLSPVPRLTSLDCRFNGLAELDLSPVPELTELDCFGSDLTAMDLSPVPELTNLDCAGNRLTELDLSPVPGLESLACDAKVKIHNPPAGLVRREPMYRHLIID